MARPPQLTAQSLKVLGAVEGKPGSSGAELSRDCGLPSGTLYPILLRLEDAGWLSSVWEASEATELGRPRRRFYTLTPEGRRGATVALLDLLPFLKGLVGKVTPIPTPPKSSPKAAPAGIQVGPVTAAPGSRLKRR